MQKAASAQAAPGKCNSGLSSEAPFLAATRALAGGLGPTVSARVGKSAAVGGVEVW